MMATEPLYPKLYSPVLQTRTRNFKSRSKSRSRTLHPTRYYLIDFGLSRRFDPKDGEPLDITILGGDKTVPELQNGGNLRLNNPFPIDVYYIGNMIRQTFLKVSSVLPLPTAYVHIRRRKHTV